MIPLASSFVFAIAAVVVAGWIVAFLRSGRDAEDATSRVVGGIGGVIVAIVGVLVVAFGEIGSSLSMVGDQIGAHAPYIAHGVGIAVGYATLEGRLALTPETWIVAMVGVLVVLVMFDRGGR